MDLVKDIFLVLAGGLVTFLVTIAINKLQSRGPSVTWRMLPPVFFPSRELTALSVSIENSGAKSAKNLRIVVEFPENVSVESFEIQVSEKAMKYEVKESEDKNHIEVFFPSFGKDLECILGFLSKGAEPKIHVSIIGDDDVIGKEKELYSLAKAQRRRNLSTSMYMVFLTVLALTAIAWLNLVRMRQDSYAQQMDIAEVYLLNNDFDRAITEYQKIPERWGFPTAPRLYYKMAIAFAGKGEVDKSLFFLSKLQQSNSSLFDFAITNKAFDLVRSSPKFIEITAEKK